MYSIEFTPDAQKELLLLQRNAPQAIPKLKKLLAEIAEHPRTGTGQVERLKHFEEFGYYKVFKSSFYVAVSTI